MSSGRPSASCCLRTAGLPSEVLPRLGVVAGSISPHRGVTVQRFPRRVLFGLLPSLIGGCATPSSNGPIDRHQMVLVDQPSRLSAPPELEIHLASDGKAPTALERSRIGKADLDQARALLSRARQELGPAQWQLLDRKLAEAEQAWQRLDAVCRPAGGVAEVPRAHPLAGFVATPTVATAQASAIGPLFLVLAALWPASIGSQTLPPWQSAQIHFENTLRDVAQASQQVQAELEANKNPPSVTTTPRKRPPECQPVPIFPHLGGDSIHNTCADVVPPNRFPKHDVLVLGKRFDALQADADVLWEIKTDRFDTYAPFLRGPPLKEQAQELKEQQALARQCGYGFVVGVSSAAHRQALLDREPDLEIRLTGC